MEIRQFHRQIFMGAGSPGSTESNILKLQRILDDALITLSGEQQNGGMGYPYNHAEGRKAKRHLRTAARDIAMALTGMDVIFYKRKGMKGENR